MSKVLVISDLHCPCDRDGYLDFCKATYKKYKCNSVVFIGDVVDWHAVSFHAKNPDSPGPKNEYLLTLDAIKRWYAAFPKAKVCIGNHDNRLLRLAATVNIPACLIRDYKDVWKTPGWDWADSHEIDGVYYFHGIGYGGIHPAYNAARTMCMSVCMGHVHSAGGISWFVNPKQRWFGMDVGCVDSDTEYLSPTGWVKISEYCGGKVAQFDTSNAKADFAEPERYIKLPCDKMYHFETKYGISQTLCPEHDILYVNRHEHYRKIKMKDLITSHAADSNGFRGKFPCWFLGGQDGIDLTDAEIRLMVAVHADGHFPKGVDNNRCYVSVKKGRKRLRMRHLLACANIEYTEKSYENGITSFSFFAPVKSKTYDKSWWKASYEQLVIISEESLLWDGTTSCGDRYISKHKSDCDFIQYAFAATGRRASLYHDTRDKKDGWSVSIADTKTYPSLASSIKCEITEVVPVDGMKYCFTMPKGTLILRKDGNIFVTGNCGISDDAYAFAYGKHIKRKSVISCGVVIEGVPHHIMMPLEKYKRKKAT